jgi:hypothetical protein
MTLTGGFGAVTGVGFRRENLRIAEKYRNNND